MAKKPGPNKQTDELKAQIARSRDYVTRDLRGVRFEMDIRRKIRRSFRQQTGVWVTAAAVVGTLLVLLPLRKRKVYVDLESGATAKPKSKLLEAGFLLGVLRIAATMLKPTIQNFVVRKMGGYASRQQSAAKWR